MLGLHPRQRPQADYSMEEKQLRVWSGRCCRPLRRKEEVLSVPPSLGPGGVFAFSIIRGTKNTLGPWHPRKALHKHSRAVDDDKTDGVTESGVTHGRAHITAKNEAVNNAAPLPNFQISWKNKRERSVAINCGLWRRQAALVICHRQHLVLPVLGSPG